MKLENIDWNKKLIVFFGDEVKQHINNIRLNTPAYVDEFPEHKLVHPWEHSEVLEHTTHLISRGDDRQFVIITNSSYILDHLSNLMKGARINADSKYTRCNRKEAYIHKKDVGAYVCTNGEIKNALPKKGEIIIWDNLSEVAEWLSDIYFSME